MTYPQTSLGLRLWALTTTLVGITAGCRGELLTLGRSTHSGTSSGNARDAAAAGSNGEETTSHEPTRDAAAPESESETTRSGPDSTTNVTQTASLATNIGETTSEAVFKAPRSSEPVVVPVIGSDDKDDNPTLTADMLEIYFTSTRSGDSDVWFATRSSVDVDFDPPVHVSVVNTSAFESSPAIDRDGLTLWFARRLDASDAGVLEGGGLDIYVSRRANRQSDWSAPELVVNLSSAGDDIPRPPGAMGLVMPLSRRSEGDTYHLFLATRESQDGEFQSPSLLEPVLRDSYGSVDGFLTWDGEHLLWSYTRDALGDLFISRRNGSEYTQPVGLDDINTAADERDPWLSPDGKLLFFASDRDETLRIYQAELDWN